MLPDSFFEYLSKNLPMGGFQVMPFFNTSVAKSDMLLQSIDTQHLFNSFRDYPYFFLFLAVASIKL